ncbi:DNA sulfur modification protein DndB [Chryseobacterium sediminis]|uniref:DNA sulfur modification protein DndB n=1 Tax=Chryseobacterium sediminis TaxID=1679494 RepID=UPI0028650228|nr:DNA sulfur modification protein DndB [Chryseobacterium sediminis]MDR6462675.1 hypothetical protein [Chryseobacterium sediminis]
MAKLIIKNKAITNYSSEYYCIHSIQRLNSEFDTNVLTSNIPVSQLLKNRDILLVDDLKGDARWGMNKIIQRNISSKRVDEIKTEYLETQNRAIKFFPAITVVLLPKTSGEPIQQYKSDFSFFDNISGIIVEKGYEDDNYIHDYPINLKWDKNEISALVIDGQHRVSAIRNFYEDKNESSYNGTSIPVTFVIFKNDPQIDLIQATRALFIDVNNTPRLVSEEKLIFIDDRNLHRRITAKTLGANDPDVQDEDYYQKMLRETDYLMADDSFINRYLIEESGKDDEESRGFLLNHKTLFPWEISNVMTIHKNILGNILLRYKNAGKTRDIRGIASQLNSNILEEINSAESVEEFSIPNFKHTLDRLLNGGLDDSELEIFKNLMLLKKKNLEEIQQARGEFFIGTSANTDEDQDREELIEILENIYDQDCSKDSAFELSAKTVSEILKRTCSIYIELLTKVYNKIWFTKQIKNSVLAFEGEDRKLIFNFILNAHESLKIQSNIRRRSDKVEKQISLFLNETDNTSTERRKILTSWAKNIEDIQSFNLLRTVVGQEMLFLFIIEQSEKLTELKIDDIIKFINTLGTNNFFSSRYSIELNFFDNDDLKIVDFNQWSEIIIKGDNMKPGIANAIKGSNLISIISKKITNRISGDKNLKLIDKVQKSYGSEVIDKIANGDPNKHFMMYNLAKEATNLERYLTKAEIEVITENFDNAENLTQKAISVITKLYGGIALEQVTTHFIAKL